MSARTCAHCGAPITRPDTRFCPRCGQPWQSAAHTPTLASPAGAPRDQQAAATAPLTLPPVSARLLVQETNATYTIALGQRGVTLGRAADSDIVLHSLFVSARHARIEPEGHGHRIIDVGSTNGVLAEGRRISPHTPLTLADGDVLRIGDRATGNFVTLTYHNPQAVRAARATQVARSYLLDPHKPTMTIGREGNDISLDNPQVSRRHAVIEREGNGHLLRDVGSTNGSFVDGQRITQHRLAPGDVIQIGPFKLVYDGDSLDEYDQRGALRLDARGLARAVTHAGATRLILDDVSLSIAPREFVALVGGSGAGKSTLLNALAGYASTIRGQVLVNGDDLRRNFDAYRSLIGYVPQDDSIHRALPVERALDYAARLRLPADTRPAEVQQRIERVLEDVEMRRHRATLVDQLSGGQRKRVSIAAELLADPSLFFLDEPTSGLDPGLEKKLMYTLRRLADSGRTIVLVTHATANITQCDHVAFLAEGRLVYFGPPDEALTFFKVASGDFADIYSKLEGRADQRDPDRWAIVQRDLQAEHTAWQATHPDSPAPALAELWAQRFRAAPQYGRYVATRLAETPEGPVTGDQRMSQSGARVRVSLLRQFRILTRRYADLLMQDQRNMLILLLQAPIIGLLLALVANPGALVGEHAFVVEARKILFMLATVAVWFGIINAAREIAKEAPIYWRERRANLRIMPYVASKVVVLALLVLAQSLVLLALVGLKVQLPAYGVLLPAGLELLITTVLTAMAGLALGLLLSTLASTPDRAISIVPLALIPQILFSGVIFSLDDGLGVQRVLSWLTISRWAMDAYGTTANINELPFQAGMLRLPNPPAEYAFTPLHLVSCWLILVGYMAACLGLTCWLLKRRD